MNNLSLGFWVHPLLLLIWLSVGVLLRFTNLADKTPSTSELATLVFSLGNSLLEVPLDRALPLESLLQPLQFNSTANIHDVTHYLINEDTHPPTYFVLTHLWMKLFSINGELDLLWTGRSLSAIFGIASIPAIFSLGYLAFRSRLVGQIAAALMAVSPYGIYLAQEARHYTLAVLWSIASLACLAIATRYIWKQTSFPIWVGLTWIGVNSLGIASHYLFFLILCSEGLVIAGFWLWDFRCRILAQPKGTKKTVFTIPLLNSQHWRRIYIVAVGTLMAGLVWLPVTSAIPNYNLIQWIQHDLDFKELLEPIARLLVWVITMLFMLPVEGQNLPVIIASALILLLFLIWVCPAFICGIRTRMNFPSTRLITQVLGGFVLAAIAVFLVFTYGLGIDLTLAARYHFVYFPALIVLLGAALASCWEESYQIRVNYPFFEGSREQGTGNREQGTGNGEGGAGEEKDNKLIKGVLDQDFVSFPRLRHPSGTLKVKNQKSEKINFAKIFKKPNSLKARGKKVVGAVLLMGLIGALTVVSNLGYQKSRRPDLLVSQIQSMSDAPVLIATEHQTHAETRALMVIAWEFKHLEPSPTTDLTFSPPQFLLAHEKDNDSQSATAVLYNTLAQQKRPLDLWTINFHPTINPETYNCQKDSRSRLKVNGYSYRLYHCN
ncbi:MAG: glycosyltransferase [Xenococcaceae cyanobacterium]